MKTMKSFDKAPLIGATLYTDQGGSAFSGFLIEPAGPR